MIGTTTGFGASDGPAAECYFECDETATTSLLREAEAQEALRLSVSHRRAVDFEAQLVACRKAVALAARVAEAEQERTLLLRAGIGRSTSSL